METYINVKGQERFLYRQSISSIDFLLAPNRDAAAAKRFFRRPLVYTGNPMPRVIIDKEPRLSGGDQRPEAGTFLKRWPFAAVQIPRPFLIISIASIPRSVRQGVGSEPYPLAEASSKGRHGGSDEVYREAVRYSLLISAVWIFATESIGGTRNQ
jgi:hypothetical protein